MPHDNAPASPSPARLVTTLRLALLCAALSAGACSCAHNPGDACDASADTPCPDGLVCQDRGDGAQCLVVVGGACDVGTDDAFCADGSACAPTVDCEGPPCGVCGGRGAACSGDDQCADDTCADVGGGDRKCEPPVRLQGKVVDALDDSAVAGADVIALDVDGAAVSRVATSAADGTYALELIVARDAEGAPAAGAAVTTRADARDYATFPSGIRQAVPIDLGAAAADGEGHFVVENAATTIALVPLPDGEAGRPTVSGHVAAGGGGVLVVSASDGGVSTAITDSDGTFTLFNVAAGDSVVSGYAADVQLTPVSLAVAAEDVLNVVLDAAVQPTGSVSGSVNIVNGNGNGVTSVVLVVADTFDETIARGEVPRGLRASDVTNAFTIAGVPDGEYVVLAAFDNDGLVRDPDTNIGGTALVHVVVGPGNRDVAAPQSFKVTGALDVFSPGADGLEKVTAAPDFVFADDSSEDRYDIVLFDALGTLTFEASVDGQSGNQRVTVPYTGPALTPGMIYQYRATSVKTQGAGGESAISATEDLKGTFLFAP